MENLDKNQSSSQAHDPDEHVKSAWEIAQERAEDLLKRSDEELASENAAGWHPSEASEGGEQVAAPSGEAAEYLEHLQRLQAEFSNYRKRVEREKGEFVKYAASNLVMDLLELLDDFERGLNENHIQGVPEGFLKGMQGIQRKFMETLERHGLERIKTVGEPFNPEIHEAVMQEESTEYAPGVICGEIRAGYLLGGRLLRAPLVKVAIAATQ